LFDSITSEHGTFVFIVNACLALTMRLNSDQT